MGCDQRRIEAFLHGELSDAEEEAFDEHLLACESCWQAVQEDRAGRQAIERLQMPAPFGLADRVAATIDLASRQHDDDHRSQGHHQRVALRALPNPPRRLVTAVATAVVVTIGGTLGWVLDHHPASDPPQIAKVVAMDTPPVADSPALRAGEHFDFGGQPLDVRSYRVEGITTIVATSTKPFPTPLSSHLVGGSSSTAWMATHGDLAMYGVNRATGAGQESMFLVADMPMARLPQVAAQLHLI
jgi:hypothetical protein